MKGNVYSKDIVCVFFVIIGVILLSFYVYGYAVYDGAVFNGDIEKAAQYGDSFGVLTSLFTGLAFAGLIVTILLQRKDINLQQEELQETREVMVKQNFEATFFQLTKMFNGIVESIADDLRGGADKRGRDCIGGYYLSLKDGIDEYAGQRVAVKAERAEVGDYSLYEEDINLACQRFYTSHQSKIGHYFRYLYRIFKFLDESNVKDEVLYGKLVRAQLSDQEPQKGDRFIY